MSYVVSTVMQCAGMHVAMAGLASNGIPTSERERFLRCHKYFCDAEDVKGCWLLDIHVPCHNPSPFSPAPPLPDPPCLPTIYLLPPHCLPNSLPPPSSPPDSSFGPHQGLQRFEKATAEVKDGKLSGQVREGERERGGWTCEGE